ncbi:hypothetical protein J7439_14340 [Salinisphaera sp. G21_0]|nr:MULTISPECIES: hypothetical protein [Gammaproteobacteria]MBO9482588.1 hypothetical protein [Salinisphaera sp. G21_0]MBO9495760.1 hypothetical protein [Thalassotalea sp. G20_0]
MDHRGLWFPESGRAAFGHLDQVRSVANTEVRVSQGSMEPGGLAWFWLLPGPLIWLVIRPGRWQVKHK